MENKIFSDQFNYNMAGWLYEKAEFCAKDLLRLNAEIDEISEIDDVKSFVHDSLSGVFFDLTKILSFAAGSDWEVSDGEFLLNNGTERLAVKYGIIPETSEHSEVMNFVVNARELLKGARSPNRTILYDFLEPLKDKDFLFQEIDRELELVRDGQLSWEKFVSKTNQILDDIERLYKDK